MRVITGRFKGRQLRTVDDHSVRPATDRVKQTLFNMLANRIELEGALVLDLFAGSGSLGLEAISRGARKATFVESSEAAVECIERNAETLGCLASTEIHETDAMSFILAARGTYDLIFADPPYRFERTSEIPAMTFEHGLLRKGGYLLIEHEAGLEFTLTPAFIAGPEKKFGRTVVTFFQHPPASTQHEASQ